jgi:diketogulonate reductase-like aldo/keto reductase
MVSEIGLGTYYDVPWMFTRMLGWRRDAGRKLDAIKAGIAGGVTLIDTAEAYKTEDMVREALQGHRREEFFVATKVTMTHLGYASVKRALEGSLRRLGTNYVDLYQIHQPNPVVPIRETMRALEELQEAGKIRAIGVSNFSLKRMKDANSALRNVRLASTQMEYSLAHRGLEKEIIPYCIKEGIAVLAYRPLGHGKLAAGGTRLEEVAREHSKTPAQVALRWLCQQPNVFPIPRASNPQHMEQDLGGSGWALDDSDLKELDEAFPRPQ